jgi:hypothetical protein
MSNFTFHLGIFQMPQICDTGPMALLPLQRKVCWGFFHPEKSWWLRLGMNPQTWVLEGSTLPLDHRSRFTCGLCDSLDTFFRMNNWSTFLSNVTLPLVGPSVHMPYKWNSIFDVKRTDVFCRTLPVPKKNVMSTTLCVAWLETLIRDMSPFLLVQGNRIFVLSLFINKWPVYGACYWTWIL